MEARDLNNAHTIHWFGPDGLSHPGEHWQSGIVLHRTDQATVQYGAGFQPPPRMSQLQGVGLLGRQNGISA